MQILKCRTSFIYTKLTTTLQIAKRLYIYIYVYVTLYIIVSFKYRV